MPPHVPRKRLRDSSPDNEPSKESKKSKSTKPRERKTTLYDDLDATATSQHQPNSILNCIADSEDESSLSSLSEAEFEDVPLSGSRIQQPGIDDSDDDDDIEFEDVAAPSAVTQDAPMPTGDLELTLNRDTRMSLTSQFGDKRGPTKRERKVRNATHGVHVLCLLWHNAVRNSWLCDPEVQAIMISHIPPRMWDDIERWRRNSGLADSSSSAKAKGKQKKGAGRDWGDAAKRLEEGVVDMSHGDPLFRLMQALVAWWKQRFRITAPGLRKWGYMSLERLDRLTKSHKEHPENQDLYGEFIKGIDGFRESAQSCRGSRDVGAQLFTALLRGLGLDARMVASLQPLGFGWSKFEDAEPEEAPKEEMFTTSIAPSSEVTTKKSAKKAKDSKIMNEPSSSSKHPRSTRSHAKTIPSSIADSDEELELDYKDSDDDSVIEMQVKSAKRTTTATTKYDNDLGHPHYWTEVMSPVTHTYLPIDAVLRALVATNRDLVETFEARGAKAEKARQVVSYIVGFSKDGTAKDVTIRYLKKQTFPGRTKGVRMPMEKVPVHNRHGKVKRYEEFDWFKSAMSGYTRGSKKCPVTEADHHEDCTDLKAVAPEKREVKEGAETLQYYKQSKDYVLERHLKREEALLPGSAPVKVFKNKGKKGKVEEEDVYLRSDVALVKSAETWHKQGRAPMEGEEPLKRVPYRAATINRRREILELEAATGEKVLQGLYSHEQTDWIIPAPIRDGVIPKNEYGNIDLFVAHMCPEGAVHVPYRGVVKVCKRLQIDYAEAVVDFEFGHRMAVPVIQGAVIAEENYETVMVELEKDEAERVRKEDEKRRKAALSMWRKFLMGLRIVERIRQDYGEIDDSVSVFRHSRTKDKGAEVVVGAHEDLAGGFLPEGYEEEGTHYEEAQQTSRYFPALEEGDQGGEDDGLIMET